MYEELFFFIVQYLNAFWMFFFTMTIYNLTYIKWWGEGRK